MAHPDLVTLSVCIRCRDGTEADLDDERGGKRFADAISAAFSGSALERVGGRLRGVRCMSPCKRPCTIALSAHNGFTYLFGDLDPPRDAAAVLPLAHLYALNPDGFLPRDARPPAIQAGILGRIPPLASTSELIEPLISAPSTIRLLDGTQ